MWLHVSVTYSFLFWSHILLYKHTTVYDGRLGCLQCLTIMNKVVKRIHVQMFLWSYTAVPSYPRRLDLGPLWIKKSANSQDPYVQWCRTVSPLHLQVPQPWVWRADCTFISLVQIPGNGIDVSQTTCVLLYKTLADLFLKCSYHSHLVLKNDHIGCNVERIVRIQE